MTRKFFPLKTITYEDGMTYALIFEHNQATDCANLVAQFDEWQLAYFASCLRERGITLPAPPSPPDTDPLFAL